MNLEDEIVELQTKIQFQEDTVQQLDEVIIQQSELIERLNRRMTELEDKLEQVRHERANQHSLKDEPPPHY